MPATPLVLDPASWQPWLGRLLWTLARVSGLCLTAPVLGATVIPATIRAALVLLLTGVLVPLMPGSALEPFSAAGVAAFVGQLLQGALLGFVLRLVFEAVAFGGQLIAQSMNLGFAETINPGAGGSTPVLGQFHTALVTLLFLALDGHLALIGLLAESLRTLPPGSALDGADGLHAVVLFGGELFAGAVRVALPAMIALLVVNAGFAAISRAAPAMNLFAVGFPITLTLGLVVLLLALRGLPGAFTALLETAWTMLRRLAGVVI